MKQTEVEGIVRGVIARHLNADSSYVFLFGSRASGGGRPASDYDIGLYQGTKIPWMIMARIKDELENYLIPVDIDLVDFAAVSQEFKKSGIQHIQIWNRPKNDLKLI